MVWSTLALRAALSYLRHPPLYRQRRLLLLRHFRRLAVNIRYTWHRRGPNTEPCGTPHIIFIFMSSSITTCLFVKWLLTSVSIVLYIYHLPSSSTIWSHDALLKAFLTSSELTVISFLCCMATLISPLAISHKPLVASAVDYPFFGSHIDLFYHLTRYIQQADRYIVWCVVSLFSRFLY